MTAQQVDTVKSTCLNFFETNMTTNFNYFYIYPSLNKVILQLYQSPNMMFLECDALIQNCITKFSFSSFQGSAFYSLYNNKGTFRNEMTEQINPRHLVYIRISSAPLYKDYVANIPSGFDYNSVDDFKAQFKLLRQDNTDTRKQLNASLNGDFYIMFSSSTNHIFALKIN